VSQSHEIASRSQRDRNVIEETQILLQSRCDLAAIVLQ